jgi:hypothetical protein
MIHWDLPVHMHSKGRKASGLFTRTLICLCLQNEADGSMYKYIWEVF